MPELTSEELDKIKLEEIKKIEELERENREKQAKLLEMQRKEKLFSEKDSTAAAEQPDEDFDRIREQIRTREMIARGFIQLDGEWITREEAERRTTEKLERQKLEEEKISRAKQRKIERERNAYEEYRANTMPHVKFYSIVIYCSLALFTSGIIMSLTAAYVRTLMSTFFFPGMIATIMGLIALLTFIGLTIDAETKLIERSIFDFDNEKHLFEDENEIKDIARRLCRAIVRRLHPEFKTAIENKEDENYEEDE